jgi:hypothetical protein
MEAPMDEREREYLRQQIRQLERSNRLWKLLALTLAAACVIFPIVGGTSSILFGLPQVQQLRVQLEQARAAEAAARLQAEAAILLSRKEMEAKETTERSSKNPAAGGADPQLTPKTR